MASEPVRSLCHEYGIRELAVFGSIVTPRFRRGSDVDLLVDFLPSARIGYVDIFLLQERLGQLLGRQVQLVPRRGLKAALRDAVLASAQIVYAA